MVCCRVEILSSRRTTERQIMPAPAIIHELVERFDAQPRQLPRRPVQRDPGPARVHRPLLRGARLGRGQRAGLRRGLQGRHPRGRHQGRRRHQGARLLLPHRRHAQVLRRGQEALGQHQGRHQPGLPAPPLRLVGQAAAQHPHRLRGVRRLRLPRQARTRPTSRPPARVLYLHLSTSTPTRWDEIAGVFSREAVLKGSFDKYAESTQGQARHRRGGRRLPGGDRALARRCWRATSPCATPASTQRELNFAVQMTIDRIIFLRICEDRGIEAYGTLLALLNGARRLRAAVPSSSAAPTTRYNSGLFHFEPEKGRAEAPDELTPAPGASTTSRCKDILEQPLLPRQPLRVLRAAGRHPGPGLRAVPGQGHPPDRRPSGRGGGQAGGQEGRRRLLHAHLHRRLHRQAHRGQAAGGQDAAPGRGWLRRRKAAPMRVLDLGLRLRLVPARRLPVPAGLAPGPVRGRRARRSGRRAASPRLYQTGRGEWRLTTAERKRILLNNIYGVDIDPQAVEVTKLSLLLKVLEGESEQTLGAASCSCSTSAPCPTWAATSSAATR